MRFLTHHQTFLGILIASTLMTSVSQAEDKKPTPLEIWNEFQSHCVIDHQDFDGPLAIKAIIALRDHLNANGLSCTTYPPNPENDATEGFPPPKNLRLIITPTSKISKKTKPHPLCDLAEDRFWKATASAEICYLIRYATSEAESFDARYLGQGFEESGFFQQILLSADFFQRLLIAQDPHQFIQTHEGLQFALAQHQINEDGRKGRISPFYVSLIHDDDDYNTIVDLQLWRIPAIPSALQALALQLKTQKDTNEEEILKKMAFFIERGLTEIAYAEVELIRVTDSLHQKSANIEVEKKWDELTWAQVSYESQESTKVAILYFDSSMENADQTDIQERIQRKISTTLKNLKEEKSKLKKLQSLLTQDKAQLLDSITSK